MIITAFHSFCMALADSVPSVSGGTIAFILGFHDRFLDSLHALFDKDSAARKAALHYLVKHGAGWAVGIIACALALSGLFEKNIYFMSSLFLGLTVASLPFIAAAERPALRKYRSQMVWLILGLMLGSIYAIANGPASLSSPLPPLDMTSFQPSAFLLGVVIGEVVFRFGGQALRQLCAKLPKHAADK